MREFGSLLRVGLERGHHVHPVQRVQVVEVHQVIVHIQVQLHQVADGVGVLGNLDRQRIFHRAHRSQRVRAGTHAADTLGEGPRIARIAAFQDHFQAAPHGAGGHRVADHVVAVQIHFDAQVSFDTAHRIDHHALATIVELEALGFIS